jgi:hypothetical protein
VIDLAPGPHTIQVDAGLVFAVATDLWRIDDLSLTVVGQEF